MPDRFGPEISDLIVDYDPDTLARRPVSKAAILAELGQTYRNRRPRRIVRSLAEHPNGDLDPDAVDGVLVRAHLELQRLHEEFRVGVLMRRLLAPLIAHVQKVNALRKVRVVDVGCGLGFIVRWLAAHGELGDDVELIGVDYNQALLHAASMLAREEHLRCSFAVANAFRLEKPADIYISTGVLHHFRGAQLARLFENHHVSPAVGFLHLDIRPSLLAPLGAYIFHVARMREPLAKWDGYWSAVRAHPVSTLVAAARQRAPRFSLATLDANPGMYVVARIFQALVGVHRLQREGETGNGATFTKMYAGLHSRMEIVSL